MDINPLSKGHCLVIPKKHAEKLVDMDDDAARGKQYEVEEADSFVQSILLFKVSGALAEYLVITYLFFLLTYVSNPSICVFLCHSLMLCV